MPEIPLSPASVAASPEWPIDWRSVESAVPFEALPRFHRHFLQHCGVLNAEQLPLRRVQQQTEVELNRLVLVGQTLRIAQPPHQNWQLSQVLWQKLRPMAQELAVGVVLPA